MSCALHFSFWAQVLLHEPGPLFQVLPSYHRSHMFLILTGPIKIPFAQPCICMSHFQPAQSLLQVSLILSPAPSCAGS